MSSFINLCRLVNYFDLATSLVRSNAPIVSNYELAKLAVVCSSI